MNRKEYDQEVKKLLAPVIESKNPTTREKCLPLLLRAYERSGDLLGAARVKAALAL